MSGKSKRFFAKRNFNKDKAVTVKTFSATENVKSNTAPIQNTISHYFKRQEVDSRNSESKEQRDSPEAAAVSKKARCLLEIKLERSSSGSSSGACKRKKTEATPMGTDNTEPKEKKSKTKDSEGTRPNVALSVFQAEKPSEDNGVEISLAEAASDDFGALSLPDNDFGALLLPDNDFGALSLPEDSEEVVGDLGKKTDKEERTLHTKKDLKPTPLEQQVLELKRRHPKLLLFIECGYMHKFFGQDAEVAAKVLNVSVHLDRMFMVASVPTFNGPTFYVRKLVDKGYKVGIVSQTESAAVKKSGGGGGGSKSSSACFNRELTAVYSATTLCGEEIKSDETGKKNADDLEKISGSESAPPPVAAAAVDNVYKIMLCVYEGPSSISLVGVQPTSGKVVWDELSGRPAAAAAARDRLRDRLGAIQPLEVVTGETQSCVTDETRALLKSHTDCGVGGRVVRTETVPESFFDPLPLLDRLPPPDESPLALVLPHLPQGVVRCFSCLARVLDEFGMTASLLRSRDIERFAVDAQHMRLTAQTIRNLDIFEPSSTDGSGGSSGGSAKHSAASTLFGLVNHTRTRFGARMLKSWLGAPLRDLARIRDRLDAVAWLVDHAEEAERVAQALKCYGANDLEFALMAVINKKIRPSDFHKLFANLTKLHDEFSSAATDLDICPTLLRRLLSGVRDSLSGSSSILAAINESAAKDNDKTSLFADWTRFPTVVAKKEEIWRTEKTLDEERTEIAKILGLFNFNYAKVGGNEYLIEVKSNNVAAVPGSWAKVNATKQVQRFRSPTVSEQLNRLQCHRDLLSAACADAWMSFLDDFQAAFHRLQSGVRCLAELDCLLALAVLSKQEGFCRPQFAAAAADGDAQTLRRIDVVDARNPIIEQSLPAGSQYVPNDIELSAGPGGALALVLTGPNMGGKSSYLRQTAMLAILAQTGCFVPAKRATLPVFDAVYMRMGARDDLSRGKSTLSTEFEEASSILRDATAESLVLMDELGRGTGTHDGTACAKAVLKHLVSHIRCFTLFVTHYKSICDLGRRGTAHSSTLNDTGAPGSSQPDVGRGGLPIANAFMGYVANDDGEKEDVLFLYKLCRGAADSSFGINVARLAGIDEQTVLQTATKLSSDAEKVHNVNSSFNRIVKKCLMK